MPTSKGHKNKMKAWRKTSPGNHLGRKFRVNMTKLDKGIAASGLLVSMFQSANIKMPSYEAFAKYMAELDEKAASMENASVVEDAEVVDAAK